jgi:hypothetical protein
MNLKRAKEEILKIAKARELIAYPEGCIFPSDLYKILEALASTEECEHETNVQAYERGYRDAKSFYSCQKNKEICIYKNDPFYPDPIREVYEKYKHLIAGTEKYSELYEMWQAIKQHCQSKGE